MPNFLSLPVGPKSPPRPEGLGLESCSFRLLKVEDSLAGWAAWAGTSTGSLGRLRSILAADSAARFVSIIGMAIDGAGAGFFADDFPAGFAGDLVVDFAVAVVAGFSGDFFADDFLVGESFMGDFFAAAAGLVDVVVALADFAGAAFDLVVAFFTVFFVAVLFAALAMFGFLCDRIL